MRKHCFFLLLRVKKEGNASVSFSVYVFGGNIQTQGKVLGWSLSIPAIVFPSNTYCTVILSFPLFLSLLGCLCVFVCVSVFVYTPKQRRLELIESTLLKNLIRKYYLQTWASVPTYFTV